MIVVTGANGFVGRALCPALGSAGYRVRRAVRSKVIADGDPEQESMTVGDLDGAVDWSSLMQGVQHVVHLAARVHVLDERSADPLEAFRRVNVGATASLARAAAQAGAKRFVLLSSIKVNGERTEQRPFCEQDTPRPEDAYGISKWEAEQQVWRVSKETGLETVVVRAPLVYGPGVKANFLRLVRWIDRGIPLPLASVRNLRSLVYLGNLVDAIIACLESPVAAGRTYLVSDGEDISTPDLVRRLAAAMGVQCRLLPFPVALLRVGAAMAGKSAELARLTSSLQVDSSLIRRELGWRPRFSLQQGIDETARWFKGREW